MWPLDGSAVLQWLWSLLVCVWLCDAACPFLPGPPYVCWILTFSLRNYFIFKFALCFKEICKYCKDAMSFLNMNKKMTALYLSHKVFEMVGAAGVFSQCVLYCVPVLCSIKTLLSQSIRLKNDPSVWPDVQTASTSYCPVLQHFVQSFADLGEVGPEGPAGVVQFGQELGVGVMVKDVIDAAVGLGGEVGVDQLEQHVPAASQELLHHLLVKSEVNLQVGDGQRCFVKFGLVRNAKYHHNLCFWRRVWLQDPHWSTCTERFTCTVRTGRSSLQDAKDYRGLRWRVMLIDVVENQVHECLCVCVGAWFMFCWCCISCFVRVGLNREAKRTPVNLSPGCC